VPIKPHPVSASTEVSHDGKAVSSGQTMPFALDLTPEAIMLAVPTLSTEDDLEARLG
jgi:hypothetical protein